MQRDTTKYGSNKQNIRQQHIVLKTEVKTKAGNSSREIQRQWLESLKIKQEQQKKPSQIPLKASLESKI